jgi:hypothetical protein
MAARIAAGLLVLNGVGFGIPSVLGIMSVLQGRGIAFVLGFPAYGQGPFERFGLQSTVPLLAGFLLVCVIECGAGILLWNGQRVGALLALGLLPFGAFYWWGFALPYAWVVRGLASVAIALGWRELT